MDRLNQEKIKKETELKTLVEANRSEEEKSRGLLAGQIRNYFNEKVLDYDAKMEEKTKEREENRVT
jgi:hypothetical protein